MAKTSTLLCPIIFSLLQFQIDRRLQGVDRGGGLEKNYILI